MNNFFQLVQSPKQINDFPRFERFEIASQLQDFHSLFRFFWDYSNCCFSKHLPTAWVNFDIKNGDFINFNFNPDYYKSLDLFNKSFICSHEMLHIMLEHGIRTREYPKEDMELLNKATDIVVNEMLVNDFNFDKELVKDWKKFCWIETLFEKPELVEKNKSFRYYYDLLKSGKNLKKQDGSGQGEGQLVDVHNFNDLTEDQQKQVMDVLSKLAKNLTKDEMEKFFKNKEETDEAKKINDKLDNMQAGCGAGFWSQLNIGNVKKKKKWETVIKEWEKKVVANLDHEVDRWDRKARRFSDILTGKNYYLPSSVEMDSEDFLKKKKDVIFFLDYSGSCTGFKERFFKAALSLDPKIFNVRPYTFDTQVFATSLKTQKVYGGGGTSFDILEAEVQRISKAENKPYCSSVWVLSDGYGTQMSIPEQYRKRWHWFLTSGGSTEYIPKGCVIHKLEDFE